MACLGFWLEEETLGDSIDRGEEDSNVCKCLISTIIVIEFKLDCAWEEAITFTYSSVVELDKKKKTRDKPDLIQPIIEILKYHSTPPPPTGPMKSTVYSNDGDGLSMPRVVIGEF